MVSKGIALGPIDDVGRVLAHYGRSALLRSNSEHRARRNGPRAQRRDDYNFQKAIEDDRRPARRRDRRRQHVSPHRTLFSDPSFSKVV